MDDDGRGGGNGSPAGGIDQGLFDAQRDREIRAAAPEGTFRFVKELGHGRIQDRVDPGLAQDLPWQTRAVKVKERTNLVGVGFAGWTVADDTVVSFCSFLSYPIQMFSMFFMAF